MLRDVNNFVNPFAFVKIFFLRFRASIALMVLAMMLAQTGCGKSTSNTDFKIASTPKEAASQLEQAFQSAPAQVKEPATAAATAMRSGEFEKAVVSLQLIRQGEAVTLDQGLAIHSSVVALEARLINAMAAGDPNARRAYELLKQLKRN